MGNEPLAVVIDDETIILAGMEIMLESWGYRVVAAADLDSALSGIGGLRPTVIVSDYRLRDGRSGVEAVRSVREACGSAVPGILLTGDTSAALQAEARREGLVILHKPVQPNDLRRTMENAVAALTTGKIAAE